MVEVKTPPAPAAPIKKPWGFWVPPRLKAEGFYRYPENTVKTLFLYDLVLSPYTMIITHYLVIVKHKTLEIKFFIYDN